MDAGKRCAIIIFLELVILFTLTYGQDEPTAPPETPAPAPAGPEPVGKDSASKRKSHTNALNAEGDHFIGKVFYSIINTFSYCTFSNVVNIRYTYSH